MRRALRQLKVSVGPILLQLQLRINEIRNQYKRLEKEQTIPFDSLKRLQSNINGLKKFYSVSQGSGHVGRISV